MEICEICGNNFFRTDHTDLDGFFLNLKQTLLNFIHFQKQHLWKSAKSVGQFFLHRLHRFAQIFFEFKTKKDCRSSLQKFNLKYNEMKNGV